MSKTVSIRRATSHDAAVIAHQRRLMFAEEKHHTEVDLIHMEGLYATWVADKLVAGEYLGWLAQTDSGEIVAGVGLWLREWPPIPRNYMGKQGYIENVFTLPAYRRRGMARQLMGVLLDSVHTSRVVYEIELHPTQMAYSLYSSLGFESNTGSMSQWFGPKQKPSEKA